MSRALVVTYHAVEPGRPPLCITPRELAAHLDRIAGSGARVLTVGQVAGALRSGCLPENAVAIAFDDGYASVARVAAPLLADRGLVATVFCVAARLGARSDWASRAVWAPTLPLAAAPELAELARLGWEIGSHGLDHGVLDGDLRRAGGELATSRQILEDAVGVPVRSFAYPYGVVGASAAAVLADAGFTAAATTRVAPVRPGADPLALPRVDAHYLRRPRLLAAALAGRLDVYLAGRDLAARARRRLRADYVAGESP